jgi:hypothetical protein
MCVGRKRPETTVARRAGPTTGAAAGLNHGIRRLAHFDERDPMTALKALA